MPIKEFTEADENSATFFRGLIIGPPKTGKTTKIVQTAPKPGVINCDGESALRPAKFFGAKFKGVHVSLESGARDDWFNACKWAEAKVESGEVRTVVLDTLSTLSESILWDIKHNTTLKGYDLWNAQEDQLMTGYRFLTKLKAHLIVVCHMDVDKDSVAGILPLVKGPTKKLLPGIIEDWILYELDAATGQRNFLLGPQKSWTASGRNITRTTKIPADVGLLFEELKINP